MVEGPADCIDHVVAETRSAMTEASREVLRGFEIGADAKIVRWPDRYVDEAGEAFWDTVTRLAGPAPEMVTTDDANGQGSRPTSSQRANRSILIEESGAMSPKIMGVAGRAT
jgi:hypothetical protein